MPNGTQKGELLSIPLDKIVLSTKNIRTELPNASNLRASIETQGMLEPVLVRRLPDDKFELIGGFRRFMAIKQLKRTHIDASVIVATDKEVIRVQLIENLQREDMNPYDVANGIRDMIAVEEIDQKQAAVILGVTDGFISQHLSLLKMPKSVQKVVKNGQLGIGHVRVLGKLKNEETLEELVTLAAGKHPGEGARMTTEELSNKVKFFNDEEDRKEAEKNEKQRAKTRAKAAGGENTEDEEDEAPKKKSLAEIYEETTLNPLSKTDLKELLKNYADKYENARSEDKKTEYKHVLKGIELASGVEGK